VQTLSAAAGGAEEPRLENYVVRGLVNYDDVSYDDHADFLYELAGQVVAHFRSYLAEDDVSKVLRFHQREIVQFVHAQMQRHFHEDVAGGYQVHVSTGMAEMVPPAFTAAVKESAVDYRTKVDNTRDIARIVFTGFERCIFDAQKFDSDAERKLAVILERESLKWMKPARRQFQIYYVPDFVAETKSGILMIEVKARNEMDDATVLAKRDAAREWCEHASSFALRHGGKAWTYVLVPHDEITENVSLDKLVAQFAVTQP
jgi:type III restriction enzyme